MVFQKLFQFELSDKIFTFTLDNAINGNVVIKYLLASLLLLQAGEEFFNVRACVI